MLERTQPFSSSSECTNTFVFIQQTAISAYLILYLVLSVGKTVMMFICINLEKGYPTGMCEDRGDTEQGHANSV